MITRWIRSLLKSESKDSEKTGECEHYISLKKNQKNIDKRLD